MAGAVNSAEPNQLYTVPMVVTPTVRELEVLSDRLGLGLTGTSSLKDYQKSIDGIVLEINQIENVVEPRLLVKYPRTPGYRPSAAENIYNAWFYKSTVHGAETGILSGKTVVVKDTIALAGVPMMIGNHAIEGYVPDFDATVVSMILDAGGTILGKATCEDLCFSGESFTSATGPVLNPVNTRHSAGGSSSGCAVLVKTKEADMAIGGDQAGSVRIPASYCGIVGLKPTFGLVPYTGASAVDLTLDHLGPMTSSVADCALILQAIAGYDHGQDGRQLTSMHVPSYTDQLKILRDSEQIRVGILSEGFGRPESDPKVDRLIRETLENFGRITGAAVQDVSIPLHKLGNQISIPVGLVGCIDGTFATGGVGLGHTGYYPTSMMKDVGTKLRAGMSKLQRIHKTSLLCGQYLKENYIHVYGKAQNLRQVLTREYDEVLSICDVVVMPTIPFTAPILPSKDLSYADFDEAFSKMTGNVVAANLTGHPSISIPAGTVGELPVGLMLTGKKFGEADLFRVAQAFETFLETNSLAY